MLLGVQNQVPAAARGRCNSVAGWIDYICPRSGQCRSVVCIPKLSYMPMSPTRMQLPSDGQRQPVSRIRLPSTTPQPCCSSLLGSQPAERLHSVLKQTQGICIHALLLDEARVSRLLRKCMEELDDNHTVSELMSSQLQRATRAVQLIQRQEAAPTATASRRWMCGW